MSNVTPDRGPRRGARPEDVVTAAEKLSVIEQIPRALHSFGLPEERTDGAKE